MVFVSEWEQDSCIIHGEEWLCLSITVRQQHSSSIAALIEPHRATLCLSTPPKAINSQTRKNQIFISDLFIFKSCLLKVTKEQNCLWQAHYNDSMTYCVRHEQLRSSSIILWVKSCVHYCCLPDEEICIKKKPRLSNKDYSVMIHQNQTKCYTMKQIQLAYLISQIFEPWILHSNLFIMSAKKICVWATQSD